jgi:hypothetical protein
MQIDKATAQKLYNGIDIDNKPQDVEEGLYKLGILLVEPEGCKIYSYFGPDGKDLFCLYGYSANEADAKAAVNRVNG